MFAGARAHIDAAADLTDALWRTTPDVHPAMREDTDDANPLDGLLRIPRTRINTAGPIQVAPPVEADDDHVLGLQVLATDFVGHLVAGQLGRIHECFERDEAELMGAPVHDAVLPLARAEPWPTPSGTSGWKTWTRRCASRCPTGGAGLLEHPCKGAVPGPAAETDVQDGPRAVLSAYA